jgi:hypothetical protein
MWTFVTTYINIQSSYERNGVNEYNNDSFYIEKFKYLLELDINLIIFIDEVYKTKIEKYVNNKKIKFIVIKFDELYLSKYVPQIYKNREGSIIYKNSRNIPEWAVITLSKSEILIKAIEINPFDTEIYCWIDFGIYRPAHPYVNYSIEELKKQIENLQNSNIYINNTIHMGLINWVNKDDYKNCIEFYKSGGRCTLSSQFFFGNIHSLKYFNRECVSIIEDHINNKVLHADEQICFYVLLKNPELFSLFPTDYFYAPFDVIYPHKRTRTTTELLIPNLLRDNQYKICKKIIFKLLCSHIVKKINLPDKLLNEYIEFINSYNCMKHLK